MRIRLLGIVAACLAASGCSYSPGLVDRAIDFNKAVADSTNQLLLLNALRARDRLPTYYSRLASDSANTTLQPALSMAVPIGPGSVAKGFSPQFSFGGAAQSQLALQNLDDQKFMRGVLTPVAVDVVSFYLQQGWPQELILTLAISKIGISKDGLQSLEAEFAQLCADEPMTDYCNATLPDGVSATASDQYLIEQLAPCVSQKSAKLSPAEDVLSFENYPANATQASCFQWMLRLLIALGPTPQSAEHLQVVARDVPLGKLKDASVFLDLDKGGYVSGPGKDGTVTLCKRSTIAGLALLHFRGVATSPPAGGPATGSARGAHDGSGASGARSPTAVSPPIDQGDIMVETGATATPQCGAAQARSSAHQVKLTTRSLEGMVYYLGEVLRAQQASAGAGAGGPVGTTIWSLNRATHKEMEWSLFIVEQGSPPGTSPVSVDFAGNSYFVPSECSDTQVCPDPQHRHRSLQVIALLNQIWGLQKEAAQMPIIPTVTVVNP